MTMMMLEYVKKLYVDTGFSDLISESSAKNDPFSGSVIVDSYMAKIINLMETEDYNIDTLEKSSRNSPIQKQEYQHSTGASNLTKKQILGQLDQMSVGRINTEITKYLNAMKDGHTNQIERRVLNNYIVYINNIYRMINSRIDPGTSVQKSQEIKSFKKKLLIAALKDRHVVSANKKSIFALNPTEDGNILSLVNKNPNLAKLQLLICAEQHKKTEIPFVSYNGAVIFSLYDNQRKILQQTDAILQQVHTKSQNVRIDFGRGKTFLSNLIQQVYGTRDHGCNINPDDPKKKVGGLYIGDKHVGYSTSNIIPDKYSLALISDLKGTLIHGKVYIGLKGEQIEYRLLDDNNKVKTGKITIESSAIQDGTLQQFSPIKYDILKAISRKGGIKSENLFPTFNIESDKFTLVKIASLSLADVSDLDIGKLKETIKDVTKRLNTPSSTGPKMIVFDEFPHIDYELRKCIRTMLPENEYNLLFISATPNVELLDILDPAAKSLEARAANDLYEIQTVEVEDATVFEKSYHGETPVLIKCGDQYYVLGHNYVSEDNDQIDGKRILTEIPRGAEKKLFQDLERTIFGNNVSVIQDVAKITQKDMFTIKDVDTIKQLKTFMQAKKYHIPLSESQSLRENRKVFSKQFDQESHIEVKSILDNSQNLVDLLETDSSSFLTQEKPGNIQYILPDISPAEQKALIDSIKAKIDEFQVKQIIYQNAKKETYYIERDGDPKQGLPENNGQKVLMLYSSANAIGGDYESFSENVGLQIINSNSTPLLSKMQQWTARYRKQYFMNELRDDCKVVVRTLSRTSEELQDNMIMEEKKHELLDALNVLRRDIIIALGAEKLDNNEERDKDKKKQLMRLVRQKKSINDILHTMELPALTTENITKAERIVEQYSSMLDRMASFRSATNLSYLNNSGNKTTQYEIKLRNLLSTDDILRQKRIQLYGDNKENKIITDRELSNGFNAKRIKCLEDINTKIDQINRELSSENSQYESDKMNIGISQLHSICLSIDAINNIVKRTAEDIFVGTAAEGQLTYFDNIKTQLTAHKFELQEKLTAHHSKILEQFPKDKSDLSFAARQSELTQAFERLLAFSKYNSFTTQFDQFKQKYIESLAERHQIGFEEINKQFEDLLKGSRKDYKGYISYNRIHTTTSAVAETAVEAAKEKLLVETKKTKDEIEEEQKRIRYLEKQVADARKALVQSKANRLQSSEEISQLQNQLNEITRLADLQREQMNLQGSVDLDALESKARTVIIEAQEEARKAFATSRQELAALKREQATVTPGVTLTPEAGNQNADAPVLAPVAGNQNADAAVLAAVAGNQNADAAVLAAVAGNQNADAPVLAPVAGNQNADAEALAAVAGNQNADAAVLAAVAGNQNADAPVLAAVAGNQNADAAVLAAVAGNQNADAAVLAAVAGNQNADAVTLVAVAGNPQDKKNDHPAALLFDPKAQKNQGSANKIIKWWRGIKEEKTIAQLKNDISILQVEEIRREELRTKQQKNLSILRKEFARLDENILKSTSANYSSETAESSTTVEKTNNNPVISSLEERKNFLILINAGKQRVMAKQQVQISYLRSEKIRLQK